MKSINDKYDTGAFKEAAKEERRREEARRAKIKKTEVDSYAECYPGYNAKRTLREMSIVR